MRVALVTCAVLPEADPDEDLLLEALGAAGVDAAMLAWDDPRGDPAAFDLCVLRSTWNYYRDPAAFRAWIGRAAAVTRVLNPPATLLWNLHKGYLRDLAARGVAVAPTAFIERGALATLLEANGWDDIVIKPAISAASFRTRRFRAHELTEACAFADELAADGDVMVQPYLRAVEGEGERAIVWIDGEVTHAVRKSARFADDHEEVSAALEVTAEERAFAARVLAAARNDGLLYARVDAIRDDAGNLRVMELELIEPSLFLLQSPGALARFVAAIRARR